MTITTLLLSLALGAIGLGLLLGLLENVRTLQAVPLRLSRQPRR